MRDRFHWARLLAFVTGLVNQELLLRNEYLAAENRILRAHLPSRLRLSDAERCTMAEIAKRLGHQALKDIARVATHGSRKLRHGRNRRRAHAFGNQKRLNNMPRKARTDFLRSSGLKILFFAAGFTGNDAGC